MNRRIAEKRGWECDEKPAFWHNPPQENWYLKVEGNTCDMSTNGPPAFDIDWKYTSELFKELIWNAVELKVEDGPLYARVTAVPVVSCLSWSYTVQKKYEDHDALAEVIAKAWLEEVGRD